MASFWPENYQGLEDYRPDPALSPIGKPTLATSVAWFVRDAGYKSGGKALSKIASCYIVYWRDSSQVPWTYYTSPQSGAAGTAARCKFYDEYNDEEVTEWFSEILRSSVFYQRYQYPLDSNDSRQTALQNSGVPGPHCLPAGTVNIHGALGHNVVSRTGADSKDVIRPVDGILNEGIPVFIDNKDPATDWMVKDYSLAREQSFVAMNLYAIPSVAPEPPPPIVNRQDFSTMRTRRQ